MSDLTLTYLVTNNCNRTGQIGQLSSQYNLSTERHLSMICNSLPHPSQSNSRKNFSSEQVGRCCADWKQTCFFFAIFLHLRKLTFSWFCIDEERMCPYCVGRTYAIYVFFQSRWLYSVPQALTVDAKSFQTFAAILNWLTHLVSTTCWYRYI